MTVVLQLTNINGEGLGLVRNNRNEVRGNYFKVVQVQSYVNKLVDTHICQAQKMLFARLQSGDSVCASHPRNVSSIDQEIVRSGRSSRVERLRIDGKPTRQSATVIQAKKTGSHTR